MKSKVIAGPQDAVAKVFDGAVIMIGGFGVCGLPENLLAALREKGVKNLTLISNNAGTDAFGIGPLIQNGQVRKMIMSYGGECKAFEEAALNKTLEVDWTPQGTLAERIRAAGAGLGGFFTPTGFGTDIAKGKETRLIEGRNFVFEKPLHADFSFIKACRGDTLGNLQYRKTSRNFNQAMATAGKTVVAEVESLVEPGAIEPDSVHTPGVYVDHLFQGAHYVKPIEKLTLRREGAGV